MLQLSEVNLRFDTPQDLSYNIPMLEKRVENGVFPIRDALNELLRSADPLTTLEKLCGGIKNRVKEEEIATLWQQQDWEKLVYFCLPMLQRCLLKTKACNIYGVDQVEIIHGALEKTSEIIRNRSYCLKQRVYIGVCRYLRGEIARTFGLSLDDLGLIRAYAFCWGRFVSDYQRQPELAEIREEVVSRVGGKYKLEISCLGKIEVMYQFTQSGTCFEGAEGVYGEELTTGPAEKHLLQEEIDRQLGRLTKGEGEVLRLRFGLGEEREDTLEGIGVRLGITTERVRQIEAKALKKLRHPSTGNKGLRDYLT